LTYDTDTDPELVVVDTQTEWWEPKVGVGRVGRYRDSLVKDARPDQDMRCDLVHIRTFSSFRVCQLNKWRLYDGDTELTDGLWLQDGGISSGFNCDRIPTPETFITGVASADAIINCSTSTRVDEGRAMKLPPIRAHWVASEGQFSITSFCAHKALAVFLSVRILLFLNMFHVLVSAA
jgi:hypothetical protein